MLRKFLLRQPSFPECDILTLGLHDLHNPVFAFHNAPAMTMTRELSVTPGRPCVRTSVPTTSAP